MVGLISGIVIGGIAGVLLKDKIMGQNSQKDNNKREIESLYAENEKFSKRNKDLERQVEDLLAELNKVRRQAKANDDSNDDLQDELDKAKRELKNIRLQNDDLARKLKEYKSAVEAQEAEISMLKQKI